MMGDERTNTAAITAFTQYLTQHKLRKTPERYAILERVFAMTDHFFIDALYKAIEADGYHVSRATVYNTIELLVDAGLVRRHTFGAQPAQYERITGITNHHHLVCSRCGKVKEIKDQEIDAMLSARRFAGFTPVYADLYIYGVCGRCSRKKKKTKEINKQHSSKK